MSGGRAARQRPPNAGQAALERVSEKILRRVPPHDPQAEQSVLGAVFVRWEVVEQLAETLRPDDFYSPVHREIFSAFLALHGRRQPIDLVTAADELARMGKLEEVGGSVYLAELATATVSAANAVHHARIVRDKARRRGMIALGMNLVDLGFDETADPAQFSVVASQVTADVLDERIDATGSSLGELIPQFWDHLRRLHEGAAYYIPTPFHKLNGLLVGFAPGEMAIVGARPGNGKTALAVNCLLHAARNGFPAGIASLEMGKLLLCGRIFSDGANVVAQRFRDGRFKESDWQALLDFGEAAYSIPLFIDDRPKRKPSELRALFRRWKRDYDLRIAAVDYLQFVSPEAPSAKREQEVSAISRELKAIAKELNIALIVPCQIGRKAEEDKRFMNSHLRESGSIEQDADVILGINPWRSSRDIPEVDMVLTKSRNSRVGEIPLNYVRDYSRFEERM